jgi:hypothetical protein
MLSPGFISHSSSHTFTPSARNRSASSRTVGLSLELWLKKTSKGKLFGMIGGYCTCFKALGARFSRLAYQYVTPPPASFLGCPPPAREGGAPSPSPSKEGNLNTKNLVVRRWVALLSRRDALSLAPSVGGLGREHPLRVPEGETARNRAGGGRRNVLIGE